MDLTHRVRVPAPLEEAWQAVLDPTRIAAVLPGTTVDATAGDAFSGTMKIKLGSSLLTLVGDGRYVTTDARAHRAVVTTTGADRRGDAAVEATHTLTLAPGGDRAGTEVTVQTSLAWSGRPGRLGDGVVADAVDRVLEVTGTRIAARVAEGLAWVPATGATSARDDERTAVAVVDHPVELGADLGGIDDAPVTAPFATWPSPSPGPAPRAPEPQAYVGRTRGSNTAPRAVAATALAGALRRNVLPYAGLAALAVFVAAAAARRVRR